MPEPEEFSPDTGLDTIRMGVINVLTSSSDPQKTLQLALTHRELALIVGSLYFPARLFPELTGDVQGLIWKLEEINKAQGFLGPPSPPGE